MDTDFYSEENVLEPPVNMVSFSVITKNKKTIVGFFVIYSYSVIQKPKF